MQRTERPAYCVKMQASNAWPDVYVPLDLGAGVLVDRELDAQSGRSSTPNWSCAGDNRASVGASPCYSRQVGSESHS
jgi:hypothetical protein